MARPVLGKTLTFKVGPLKPPFRGASSGVTSFPGRARVQRALQQTSDTTLKFSPRMAGIIGYHEVANFGFDEERIPSNQQKELIEHAATLQGLLGNHLGATIRITGHADAPGTEAHNQALGLRRANAVREFLVKNGVPFESIVTGSEGEERLAVDTKQAVSRNRRVIIKFQPLADFDSLLGKGLTPPKEPQFKPPGNLKIPFKSEEFSPNPLIDLHLQEGLDKKGKSITDRKKAFIGKALNPVLDGLGIKNKTIRNLILKGASSAVDKGQEALLDRAMDEANIKGKGREAIRSVFKAGLDISF